MRNCLILLTAGFPFGDTEPFLEPELPFLCDAYEKVIIFALDAGAADTPSRSVPEGVEYFNVTSKSKKISRMSDWIHCTAGCFHKTPAFDGEKEYIGHSIKKRLFFEYFEARAHRHFQELLPFVEKYDFSGFDNVVIYSYWFFVTARTGVLLKEHLHGDNVSLISRGHGYDIYSYANPIGYLPGRTALFRSIDKLYACSQYGCNYLKGEYPDSSHKITFSYLGTDDCGLNECAYSGIFRIVSCSRAVPLKRLCRLVGVLSLLKDSGIPLEWVHIGDGSELRSVKQLASEKLGFMTTLFPGALTNKEVLSFYHTEPINLFVNISRTEGLPVSIIEACSFGIPAVATDVGGTSEIVADGVSGFLIPSDFTDRMLADKIAEIASMEPEKYAALRKSSRKKWEDSFCSKDNYEKFIDEISSL